MTANSRVADLQDPFHELKTVLLEAPSIKLERLAGCLLGCLLGVPTRMPRSGDQHGGDGGVSGAGGRHLIFEARRYRDDTRLDERSILGEIQQAVERAPYLEVWILVTTREVPEQTQLAIVKSAEDRGNWSRHHRLAVPSLLPQLAAYSPPGIPSASQAEIGKGHEVSPGRHCRDAGF